ncbi:MAG: hypothetical protein ABJQ07_08555 [Erythrobacter sp.]
MDEDKVELIRQLYTRAGMEMEDASITALESGSPQSDFNSDKVRSLEQFAQSVLLLLKAVRSISE